MVGADRAQIRCPVRTHRPTPQAASDLRRGPGVGSVLGMPTALDQPQARRDWTVRQPRQHDWRVSASRRSRLGRWNGKAVYPMEPRHRPRRQAAQAGNDTGGERSSPTTATFWPSPWLGCTGRAQPGSFTTRTSTSGNWCGHRLVFGVSARPTGHTGFQSPRRTTWTGGLNPPVPMPLTSTTGGATAGPRRPHVLPAPVAGYVEGRRTRPCYPPRGSSLLGTWNRTRRSMASSRLERTPPASTTVTQVVSFAVLADLHTRLRRVIVLPRGCSGVRPVSWSIVVLLRGGFDGA